MIQGFDLIRIRREDFKRGAASRQAEIDELKRELEILQGMHNAVSLEAGKLVDERDELQRKHSSDIHALHNVIEMEVNKRHELQKRIDKTLYKLPWLNWKNIDGKMKGEIMDILKGKKDE